MTYFNNLDKISNNEALLNMNFLTNLNDFVFKLD